MAGIIPPIAVIDALNEALALIVVEISSGIVQYASKPAEELFGFKMRGDMAGHTVEELMPESFRAIHPSHRASYDADPHTRQMGDSEMRLIARQFDTGREFEVEIVLIPLKMEGKRCTIAVILDLTERQRS